MSFSSRWAWALVPVALASCREEVYRNLSQRDANEMVAVLAQQGIPATRDGGETGGYRVLVPGGDFPAAVEALKRAGYPRESFRTLAEVFPADGLVVSPFEQRARMMFALNQEIGRTVSGIDGVVSARVHVVVPELDLRGAPQSRASASVVVHYRSAADPDELVPKIRQIVAASVQGLNPRDDTIASFVAQPGSDPDLRPALPARALGGGFGTLALFGAALLALGGGILGLRGLFRRPG